jgi:hypothetical protein
MSFSTSCSFEKTRSAPRLRGSPLLRTSASQMLWLGQLILHGPSQATRTARRQTGAQMFSTVRTGEKCKNRRLDLRVLLLTHDDSSGRIGKRPLSSCPHTGLRGGSLRAPPPGFRSSPKASKATISNTSCSPKRPDPLYHSQAWLPAYFLAGRVIGLTPTCSSAVYGAP